MARENKFIGAADEVKIPICNTCIHAHADNTCDAFPDGIPSDILNNFADHTKPYKGDGGIQYEAAVKQ